MSTRKRILIFTHDGRGLGHLRRLSRIAGHLQSQASVLFASGHREVAQMVPRGCEFVHLPSLDSIDTKRSRQWGRTPFLMDDAERGWKLRIALLTTIMDVFDPDGFISDYLPLGIEQELIPLLAHSQRCRNYFIVRGVLDHPDHTNAHVLTQQGRRALKEFYKLIFATCDTRIVDIAKEYSLEPELVDRLVYTGYAVEPFDRSKSAQAREDRLLPPGAKWVVCTAGGGKDGEDLLQRCWELALQFPECYFDLILGPRSRLTLLKEGWYSGTRILVQGSDPQTMPYRLGGADVVICRGGYNSLMEACVGNARIIAVPIASDYEQVEHARRLNAFRPIDVLSSLDDLDLALEKAVESGPVEHRFHELNTDGLAQTARMILADLAQHNTGSTNQNEVKGAPQCNEENFSPQSALA